MNTTDADIIEAGAWAIAQIECSKDHSRFETCGIDFAGAGGCNCRKDARAAFLVMQPLVLAQGSTELVFRTDVEPPRKATP